MKKTVAQLEAELATARQEVTQQRAIIDRLTKEEKEVSERLSRKQSSYNALHEHYQRLNKERETLLGILDRVVK